MLSSSTFARRKTVILSRGGHLSARAAVFKEREFHLFWARSSYAAACYPAINVPTVPNPELLFYDGHCALCHGAVQFVLKHDRSGNAFRFAPLQGSTFQSRIAAEERASFPDSIIVLTNEGTLLMRSDAFLHILRRLGGGWRFGASFLGVIPRHLRDLGYDFIARIRYRVFGTRDDLCPAMPPELRARFDP